MDIITYRYLPFTDGQNVVYGTILDRFKQSRPSEMEVSIDRK